MANGVVVVDVNILPWIHKINPGCEEVLEFMINAHGSDQAVGEHEQIEKNDHCGVGALRLLDNHNVSDDAAARWLMGLDTLAYEAVARTLSDLADSRLLFVAQRDTATLISCDFAVLRSCVPLGIQHHCFKAALALTEREFSGLFADPDYDTDPMWDPDGRHTFFHFHQSRRCLPCDPNRTCECHRSIPWRP